MIAVIYPQFYGVGGIARYLDSFFSNLPEDHPPIYLITGDEGKLDKTYLGVEIIHIPFKSNRFALVQWSYKAAVLVRKLQLAGRVKVVNFHFPPLIPGLFLPKSVKIVLTAHTTYEGMSGHFYKVQHFKSPWNPLALLIKKTMEKIIFSKTDHVITLTEQGKREVLTYGYDGSISVVPNGVDLGKFNSTKNEVNKDIDVLFCGRIEKRKGSRPLVEVCKRLIASNSQIRISIVGYGDDDEYVTMELGKFPKNIDLVGKVPFEKMMDFYNRSKIYVSTSYYEGLPGTCLEALAMKLPVVVWDFEFYNPLVVDGVNGRLISPNQYADMVDTINALLNDEVVRRNMGSKGRELLEQNYNWSDLGSSLLRIICQ